MTIKTVQRSKSGTATMQRATSSHKAAMIASLCEAFADDPGLSWIWPDREDRLWRLPFFFKPIVSGTMAIGIAFHSADSAAVSLWRQPGRISPGRMEILRALPSMAKAFAVGRERSQLMRDTLKAHQPTSFEWWYLQFIGVRPDAQGTGLGGEAIRAGFNLAKAAEMPVYVEVMNPDNVGYYHHAGFETIDEFDIPDAGPHVWGMIYRP